jgi:hypothetical protein
VVKGPLRPFFKNLDGYTKISFGIDNSFMEISTAVENKCEQLQTLYPS